MTEALRDSLATALGPSYVLGEELHGGMARVFVATDTALGRRVVVKTLGDAPLHGTEADRFRREILLAAGLQHPNIVPLLSAATTQDGTPYYVMPFVDGETLRARLARGAVPPHEVATLVRDVARALGAAHRRGIVHRDIKPENIFIADGVAVVSDFGIAMAIDAALPTRATATGTAIGTPAYMAPEQAGAQRDVGARADLYALGVVAWELLAGHHPFEGRSVMGMLVAHVSEPVPSIAESVPGIPNALASIVDALLQKEPARRPSDADSVVIALSAAVTPGGTLPLAAAAPVGASSGGASVRVGGPRRLGAWLAVAGAVVVAVLVAVPGLQRWWSPAGAATDAIASDDPWSSIVWAQPITEIRVPLSDTALHALIESAALRARGAVVVSDAAARASDAAAVAVRRRGGAVTFETPSGTAITSIPLELPLDEVRSRAAGVLLILESDVLGAWALPRGLPPHEADVRSFLAIDRIARSRPGSSGPEMSDIVLRLDSLIARVPDWPAPALLMANRLDRPVVWTSRERVIAFHLARQVELTPAEQTLLDVVASQMRSDANAYRAALKELALVTRSADFARSYGQSLMQEREFGDAARILTLAGPGPGREHLAYWSALTKIAHTRGRHEEELVAARENVRESVARVGVRLRLLRALAAMGRDDELMAEVRSLPGLPTDSYVSAGWAMKLAADELEVHGRSAAARALRLQAQRWYVALPTSQRTQTTAVEGAHLFFALGSPAAAGAALDSVTRVSSDPDIFALRAVFAARAGDRVAADSLLSAWRSLPKPNLSLSTVIERVFRTETGVIPGDSTMIEARLASLAGDGPRATGLIRRGIEKGGWGTWIFLVHADPDFARVRALPEVRALLGAP